MRVVIADDSVLPREGLARLLTEAGVEVCAKVGDAAELVEAVSRHEPDVAVVDIRMPPTFTHEGAAAAVELRAKYPSWGYCCCPRPSRPTSRRNWSNGTRSGSATCSRTG